MPETHRAPGFYWIRYSGWLEIGFWLKNEWLVLGSEAGIADAEVTVLAGPLEPPQK